MKKPRTLPIVQELGQSADWPTATDKEKLEKALAVSMDAFESLEGTLKLSMLISFASTVCLNTSDPLATWEAISGSIKEALDDFVAGHGHAC